MSKKASNSKARYIFSCLFALSELLFISNAAAFYQQPTLNISSSSSNNLINYSQSHVTSTTAPISYSGTGSAIGINDLSASADFGQIGAYSAVTVYSGDPIQDHTIQTSYADTVNVTSSTLANGTAVTLRITMFLDAILSPTNSLQPFQFFNNQVYSEVQNNIGIGSSNGNFASFRLLATNQNGAVANSGVEPVTSGSTQFYNYVGSGTYSVVFGFDTFVGDQLTLGNTMLSRSLGHVNLNNGTYSSFADASHTRAVLFDTLTPSTSLLFASSSPPPPILINPSPVPETKSNVMLLLGLCLLGFVDRNKKNI